MSRAYRIRVHESLRRILRAADKVSTQLELLTILPAEQMAELLGAELGKQGFERDGGHMRRKKDGSTVTVELSTGTVTVEAATTREVNVEAEQTGYAPDARGQGAKRVEEHLREQLKKSLKKRTDDRKQLLQTEVTDRLEAQLGDLRRELDQAANRATAAALKKKAAQLGTIKQVSEDAQSGNLTIVLEV
jgi:hypothetical protein